MWDVENEESRGGRGESLLYIERKTPQKQQPKSSKESGGCCASTKSKTTNISMWKKTGSHVTVNGTEGPKETDAELTQAGEDKIHKTTGGRA